MAADVRCIEPSEKTIYDCVFNDNPLAVIEPTTLFGCVPPTMKLILAPVDAVPRIKLPWLLVLDGP